MNNNVYENKISREFNAIDEELNAINEFIEEELEKLECTFKVINQIEIAAEELFVNIAHYAYHSQGGPMTLSIIHTDATVALEFVDSGAPFNPLEKQEPDITLSAKDRKIGGLGIFMVKKLMDEVDYKYEDSKNILTIVKNK